MNNLEMLLFGILIVLFMMLGELWGNLSAIADKLQDINRNIDRLKEEDDE